jgi:hypothetical protein
MVLVDSVNELVERESVKVFNGTVRDAVYLGSCGNCLYFDVQELGEVEITLNNNSFLSGMVSLGNYVVLD